MKFRKIQLQYIICGIMSLIKDHPFSKIRVQAPKTKPLILLVSQLHLILYKFQRMSSEKAESFHFHKKATIVVVGDIGHSPRMCNHAHSLASHGLKINLIGYLSSRPHERICTHSNIRITPLSQPPKLLSPQNTLLRFALLPFKLIWIFVALLQKLMAECPKDPQRNLLILQNPPGIPTMLVCYLIARIKNMQLIVDWHNYSFSMFGNKWIAKLLYSFEGVLGRRSNLNICVSKAMRDDLLKHWNINSIVLYDRPSQEFSKVLGMREKHVFLTDFLSAKSFDDVFIKSNEIIGNGIFTWENEKGEVQLREDRPLFLISCTSWTPDEDFSLLLDALRKYDGTTRKMSKKLPKILVVITGKGPQKEMYLERIRSIHWENVLILTAWLQPEDYPKLLSCADLGVCLHTSTTGLDLPMKIVDMFGSGLPVLAKNFPALPELVKNGKNGILFDSSEDLMECLLEIADDFPNNALLLKLRGNAMSDFASWEENWNEVLWPVLCSNDG